MANVLRSFPLFVSLLNPFYTKIGTPPIERVSNACQGVVRILTRLLKRRSDVACYVSENDPPTTRVFPGVRAKGAVQVALGNPSPQNFHG